MIFTHAFTCSTLTEILRFLPWGKIILTPKKKLRHTPPSREFDPIITLSRAKHTRLAQQIEFAMTKCTRRINFSQRKQAILPPKSSPMAQTSQFGRDQPPLRGEVYTLLRIHSKKHLPKHHRARLPRATDHSRLPRLGSSFSRNSSARHFHEVFKVNPFLPVFYFFGNAVASQHCFPFLMKWNSF